MLDVDGDCGFLQAYGDTGNVGQACLQRLSERLEERAPFVGERMTEVDSWSIDFQSVRPRVDRSRQAHARAKVIDRKPRDDGQRNLVRCRQHGEISGKPGQPCVWRHISAPRQRPLVVKEEKEPLARTHARAEHGRES